LYKTKQIQDTKGLYSAQYIYCENIG